MARKAKWLLGVMIGTLVINPMLSFAEETAQPQTDLEYVTLFNRYLATKNPELQQRQLTQNYTPLHMSVVMKDPKLAVAALNSGVPVDAKAAQGLTPLHMSVLAGQHDISMLLLSRHANVNSRDAQGHTPLHFAASVGDTMAVKYLVAGGATLEAYDHYGATPITMARTEKRTKTVELLVQLGAKARVNSVIREDHQGYAGVSLTLKDPLMMAATKQAKQSLARFWLLYRQYPQSALVKFTLKSGQEVWAMVMSREALKKQLRVQVITPLRDRAERLDRVINDAQIEDWSVEASDSMVFGKYSFRATCDALVRELGYLPENYQLMAKSLVGYQNVAVKR